MNDQTAMIEERQQPGKIAVLGEGKAFHSAISKQLGFSLPQTPNTVETHDGVSALWLSPSEWLVVTPEGKEQALTTKMQQGLGKVHGLVVDVSDRWAIVSLSGPQSVAVLGKGTSVKLATKAGGSGWCCQTRLFTLPAIIQQTDDQPSFDIFIDSTLSDYLQRWLEYSIDDTSPQPSFSDA